MLKSPRLIAAALFAVVAAGGAAARADLVTTVTANVAPNAAGTFDYTYLVANSPTSTVGVTEFDLSASDIANLVNIVNPDGFVAFYATGFPDVEFTADDGSNGISPGATGTFSFTADVGPAVGAYSTAGFDGPTESMFESFGDTLVPTGAVPEPTTAGLAVAGIALAASGRRRTRG